MGEDADRSGQSGEKDVGQIRAGGRPSEDANDGSGRKGAKRWDSERGDANRRFKKQIAFT